MLLCVHISSCECLMSREIKRRLNSEADRAISRHRMESQECLSSLLPIRSVHACVFIWVSPSSLERSEDERDWLFDGSSCVTAVHYKLSSLIRLYQMIY